MSFGHGDEDNERILRFANPALDGGKNEEDEHGEGRDAERHADEEDNETSALDKGKDEEDEHAGDENEMSTPTFSNPALDKGKDDEHEDEEKNEDEAEERGNGNNDETTVDPDLNEKKNEEPQPEETIVQEGVVGGPIGGLQEAFYKLSCPQAEKVVNETLHKHLQQDPSLAPAVLRLFFHDCFVTVRPSRFVLDIFST